MAFALIANAAAGSTDGIAVDTTGTPINTSGADLIVIGISDYVGSPAESCNPTDSKGNSWTGLTAHTAAASTHIRIWYSRVTSVGSGHTFTCTGVNSSFPTITVAAFSGSVATPADQESGGTTAGGTSLATGSITPGETNELIISVVCFGATGGATVNEGMSETDDVAYLASNHLAGAMAYKIQTTATAINPTWTFSSSEACAAVASFKDTPGGGGAGPVVPTRTFNYMRIQY